MSKSLGLMILLAHLKIFWHILNFAGTVFEVKVAPANDPRQQNFAGACKKMPSLLLVARVERAWVDGWRQRGGRTAGQLLNGDNDCNKNNNNDNNKVCCHLDATTIVTRTPTTRVLQWCRGSRSCTACCTLSLRTRPHPCRTHLDIAALTAQLLQ